VGSPVPPPSATTRRSEGVGVETRRMQGTVSEDPAEGDGGTA